MRVDIRVQLVERGLQRSVVADVRSKFDQAPIDLDEVAVRDSRTPGEPLPWPNSTPLHGDVVDAVNKLKHELTGDLTVMGSGELIQTLMNHDLIDEYLLFIHPLVLRTGRLLFGEGIPPASLRLMRARPRRPA